MNQKQYLATGLMVGSILGALVVSGIVIAIMSGHQPAPASQIAATSTATVATASISVGAPLSNPYAEFTSPTISQTSTSYIDPTKVPNCLMAKMGGSCLLTWSDFLADITLLKAIRSGNFTISGNNISIPIGNGSSSNLMSVLNYMQSEIAK
jgi:hypothetical protein